MSHEFSWRGLWPQPKKEFDADYADFAEKRQKNNGHKNAQKAQKKVRTTEVQMDRKEI